MSLHRGLRTVWHNGLQLPHIDVIVTVWIGEVVIVLCLLQPVTGGLTRFFLNHFNNKHNRYIFQSWYYELAHVWV
jgi:hypothetical protein